MPPRVHSDPNGNRSGAEPSRGFQPAEPGRGPRHRRARDGEFDALVRAALEAAAPALAALDAVDVVRFRTEAGRFAAEVVPVAERSAPAAAVMLFDVLNRVATRLSLDEAVRDEELSRRWIVALAAGDGPLAMVRVFLAEIDRLTEPFVRRRAPIHPTALRARQFIETNASRAISLSRVAEALGVAPSYLSSLFRRECGTTLTEYIHQVRIGRAEVLLRAGDRSIADVAREVGYQSYRHFYRSFLKLRKVPPKVFVRSLKSPPPPPATGATDPDSRRPASGV